MAEAAEDTKIDPAADIDAAQAQAEDKAAPEQESPEPGAELSEAERLAALMGWKPKDQWKGDDATWRPAEEFLADQPRIAKRTRETIGEYRNKLDRIIAQVAKLEQTQKSRTQLDLEAKLVEATEAGNTDAVLDITRKLVAEAKTAEPVDQNPAFTAFQERNDWYGSDKAATAYVHALDQEYAAEAGGPEKVNAADHFRRIEREVKKRFPDLFVEPETREKPKPPLVGRGSVVNRRTSGELTVADLSPQQRNAAREYGVTLEAYVKALNHDKKRQVA